MNSPTIWAVATTGTLEALAKSIRYSINCLPSMYLSVALLPTMRRGRWARFIIATAISGFCIGFAFFVEAISAHCHGSQDIVFPPFTPSFFGPFSEARLGPELLF